MQCSWAARNRTASWIWNGRVRGACGRVATTVPCADGICALTNLACNVLRILTEWCYTVLSWTITTPWWQAVSCTPGCRCGTRGSPNVFRYILWLICIYWTSFQVNLTILILLFIFRYTSHPVGILLYMECRSIPNTCSQW